MCARTSMMKKQNIINNNNYHSRRTMKCSVNVSHRLHVSEADLWVGTVRGGACVCAMCMHLFVRERTGFVFNQIPATAEKMIPRSLVNFLLLINEPYTTIESFLFLTLIQLWFDSDFFLSIPTHCNKVFNNLQNDLNRSFYFILNFVS